MHIVDLCPLEEVCKGLTLIWTNSCIQLQNVEGCEVRYTNNKMVDKVQPSVINNCNYNLIQKVGETEESYARTQPTIVHTLTNVTMSTSQAEYSLRTLLLPQIAD